MNSHIHVDAHVSYLKTVALKRFLVYNLCGLGDTFIVKFMLDMCRQTLPNGYNVGHVEMICRAMEIKALDYQKCFYEFKVNLS